MKPADIATTTPPGADLQAALARQCDAARLLRLQGRTLEAAALLRGVLRVAPRHTGALLDLGGLLMLLGQMELARQCYARLLRLQPGHGLALYNLGQALEELGQLEPALEAYQAAHALAPDAAVLYHAEFVRLSLCDWHDYDARMAQLCAALAKHVVHGARPLAPLRLLSLPAPLALHRQVAEHYSDAISNEIGQEINQETSRDASQPTAAARNQPADPPAAASHRIRVGYLSADFRSHAMGGLLHGVFAQHSRPQFEVFAYSLMPEALDDHYTAAIRAGVDHFCSVADASAPDIAARMQADGIDVLIDLMGHTHLGRPAVLALRAAPVQLHYLGYPGTLGADFIDGVIADAALIPPQLAHGYRERVYHLPCAFVASAPLAATGMPGDMPPLSRADMGLPTGAVVYASFHRPHKLDPHTFALWLQILMAVPGSVLWLVQAQPLVKQRLLAAAALAGVDASRLVFSQPVAPHRFAQLCTLADLLLDTAHYGAGATGVTALRAGLPLLTCPGATFASRMGASLCAATGLTDLICDSPSAYQGKAIELGREPSKLAAYRHQLTPNKNQQHDPLPLFQTAAWVKNLEALLVTLVQKL